MAGLLGGVLVCGAGCWGRARRWGVRVLGVRLRGDAVVVRRRGATG
ncbi:hypothetical protein [Streptomyces sp. HNM1019]